MNRYPGKWAETSGSDAHSLYTAGYNWTEFEGNSAEDLRKAILHKTTVAVGTPAPVLTQMQWSYEVARGGQALLRRALKGDLESRTNDVLRDKVNNISDIKKATGLYGAYAYEFPLTLMLATTLSTAYLRSKSHKAMKHIDERLAKIDKIMAGKKDVPDSSD